MFDKLIILANIYNINAVSHFILLLFNEVSFLVYYYFMIYYYFILFFNFIEHYTAFVYNLSETIKSAAGKDNKMLLNVKNIKTKIVFFSTLCIAVIGVAGNFYLYTYMNGIIAQKAKDIDALYMDSIQKQLDTQFNEIINLAILCSSNYEISNALRHTSLLSSTAKKDIFSAQALLNEYLRSSTISSYVNKMLLFNDSGLTIQAAAKQNGGLSDLDNLLATDFYQNYQTGDLPFQQVLPSVTPYKGNCLTALFPVSNYLFPSAGGFLYIEVDLSVITDTLKPYSLLNPIFAVPENGPAILPDTWTGLPLEQADLNSLQNGQTIMADSKKYRIDIRPLDKIGLSLYNCTNISAISIDNRRKIYALSVVVLSALFTSLGIWLIITNYITRPLHKLVSRIKRISEKDFTVDLSSEKRDDEIGEVFKVINEMSLSIDKLLRDNAEQNEQKKNIEIDLLQSQVNPHFLYNTLDSIHWMAVIQKNTGICNITRCLSNLLKNMSKGFSQKISLKEELSLLDDYITIQSIRYMETFELVNHIDKKFYHYSIVKLTLQPLVENAIFHGIEPSGVYGTITLDASEDELFLNITVTDTGVGMTQAELANALETSAAGERHSMNGIGIGNVNKRLQLVYGPSCGLTITSQKGKGTCILVRILKEE